VVPHIVAAAGRHIAAGEAGRTVAAEEARHTVVAAEAAARSVAVAAGMKVWTTLAAGWELQRPGAEEGSSWQLGCCREARDTRTESVWGVPTREEAGSYAVLQRRNRQLRGVGDSSLTCCCLMESRRSIVLILSRCDLANSTPAGRCLR
jgi:hypothetical protein